MFWLSLKLNRKNGKIFECDIVSRNKSPRVENIPLLAEYIIDRNELVLQDYNNNVYVMLSITLFLLVKLMITA